jgi:multicomponent Na+:H+ antiporter subunit B
MSDVAETAADQDGGDRPTAVTHDTTVIARTVVRAVAPLMLLTAIALLLQGHNLPGGGFIGGVLTAIGIALIYVIFGIDYLQSELLGMDSDDGERDLVRGYRGMFAFGLGLAFASGLAPIALGFSFMTQAVTFVDGIPLYGTMEVASALAFDVGVYFTVVGALLAIVGEVGGE